MRANAAGDARPLNVDLQSTILNPQSAISHPPSSIQHPPSRLAHVPRLSIGFLLLWMAATAVVLPLFMLTSLLGRPELWSTAEVAIVVFGVAVFGWLLAGALLIGRHAWQNTLWPLEPGEWLVLGYMAPGVIGGLLGIFHDLMRGPSSGSLAAIFLLLVIASQIYLAGAIWQQSAWWRTLMLVFAVGPLFAMPPLPILLLFLPPVAMSLLVVAVLGDRRRRDPRHWLHWSGVAFTGLGLVGLTVFELFGVLWLLR